MYLREDYLPFPAPGEMPYSEQEEVTENAQRRQMQRDCKDVPVLEWLEKDGPASLREYIAQLEARLSATPRLVEGHKLLAKLKAKGLNKRQFDEALHALLKRYPEMNAFYFPPEYVVQSVEKELAQVRCKLSRARLNFQIWHRTGTPPRDAGFIRLCTPPPRPRGPLIFWTIGGFAPNHEKLNKSQLAEIDLIAKGLAKNPRTR